MGIEAREGPPTSEQDRLAQTAEIIDRVITSDTVLQNLKSLQPPAPSGTILHTRTPIIAELLKDSGVDQDRYTARHLGTRSPAVFLNTPKRLWYMAHADEPTYIPPITNKESFDIKPICAHRPKVTGLEFPAAILRYNARHGIYEKVSEGVIGTTDNMKPYYDARTKPKDGFQPGYDRVVYTPTLAFVDPKNPQLLTGNMDNAAGIAASIASIQALGKIAKQRSIDMADFNVGWVFADMEEGLPEPACFARGARNIVHRTASNELPEIAVNVDGHDAKYPQPSVVYASYVSEGKGPIVPPDIYARFDGFLQGLARYGVRAQRTEEVGQVSRSDCAAAMEVLDQIPIVGYCVRDPHHNEGLPTINLDGLVQTAKAMTWIAAEM